MFVFICLSTFGSRGISLLQVPEVQLQSLFCDDASTVRCCHASACRESSHLVLGLELSQSAPGVRIDTTLAVMSSCI